MRTFDYLVLGAGSGGLASAFRAAKHGARVAIVEPRELGGTCVNVGCVPKKAMWYAAQLAHDFERAREYGFNLGDASLDWGHFVRRRQGYIDNIHASYRKRLDEAGIDVIRARGKLIAPDQIQTPDETLQAEHVLVATGARPRRLAVPGFELGMVSDGFFDLNTCPRSVAVIGGGYIGCELAGVLHALGARVELFARSVLLSGFDADLSDALTESMRAQGIGVHLDASVSALHEGGEGVVLEGVSHDGESSFERVLWAVGRDPNTEAIGADEVGLALDEHAHVRTDALQDTNLPGVHAIGDVTARTALTPVAIAAGRRLSDRLFGGQTDARLDYENIPSVVFSHPPVGAVGLTEREARKHHGDSVRVYRARFKPMQNSLAGQTQQAFMKLVCAGADEQVLGVHLFGPGSDEMLQGFAVAVNMGARKADLDATVAIHPTSAEELVLMG